MVFKKSWPVVAGNTYPEPLFSLLETFSFHHQNLSDRYSLTISQPNLLLLVSFMAFFFSILKQYLPPGHILLSPMNFFSRRSNYMCSSHDEPSSWLP